MTAATWRFRHGIIMFHLTMASAGRPVDAMIRATLEFLHHQRSIGAATAIELSTRKAGEDAIKWMDELDSEGVVRRLAAHPDITCIKVRCELRCVGSDDREFVIPNGMLFWSQLADLTSPPDEPIEIALSLNTGVYVPKSWGDDRNNRDLAMRNAPRFNAFLDHYLGDSGATVDDVSADDYPGQIGITGIRLSASPEA
jgi:hypothetical protein